MQARILLALVTVLAGGALGAQQSVPLEQEELLRRARVWEVRDRGDLARLSLQKLTAARPDSAEALLELGELNLRLPDMPAAQQVLSLLKQRFPGSAAARTFAVEYRFATRDRLQLASVRRLIQMGRETQAREELDRLFPEGSPGGMLGIEYYRFLASTPGGWKPAYEGLKKLAAAHPDDPRYAAALARHLLRNDTTVAEGATALSALARRDDVRVAEIDAALSTVLRDARFGLRRDIIDDYLARNPDDVEVRKALRARERAFEERELLRSGALARIDPELQQRNLRSLSGALASRSSVESRAAEGTALSELIAGQLPGPVGTADGTALAAAWMIRSRQSQREGNLELAAAQLHAAVALRTSRYEAVIPAASQIASLGERQLSGELLAAASSRDADSHWLFGTYVRWLIDNERTDEALSLLEARPFRKGWTAQSRDTLRARALDQRSQSHVAGGRIEEAIANLEEATALAPMDPWSRYRLARLYERQGDPEKGRAVLAEGARHAAGDEMRYAQSLYLTSLGDYEGALAAIQSVPAEDQSEGMAQLQARVRIELARATSQRLKATGSLDAARRALMDVEPLAQLDPDRTRQVALAWIDLGDPRRAIWLTSEYARRHNPETRHRALFARAEVLDRAGETETLSSVLDELRALPLDSEQRASAAQLQKSLDLRRIRALQREGDFRSARRRLEEMLESAPPNDRELRIARAELDLAARDPRSARDRLATLVSEQPHDMETRLTYVRALTESGETKLASAQLRTLQEQARPDDVDIQIGIARRQLAIGEAAEADQTVQAVLPMARRADALMLAGQAARARRDYTAARDYFMQAQRAGDESAAQQARVAQGEIDVRLQSWAEAAVEMREKPGEPGISRFSSVTIPSAWVYTRNDGQRFALRTDLISMDAGTLSPSFDSAALLGTILAAGPAAERSHENDAQTGVSLGIEYATDTLHADLGTTPRNFLIPQVVGGIEWTPDWGPFNTALGLSRRAVTGSVLSYGGLRDPITGAVWGGVVATGPYARIALYRERYGISATAAAAELSGTRVPDNRYFGVRAAVDWKVLARERARASLGVTFNYWIYDRNLQNYTFGSGGYYSPQSYVSVTVPVELQGMLRGWNVRLRAALSHTNSTTDRAPFHPGDLELQSQAAAAASTSEFDEPYFAAGRSSSLSMSAYAAIERQIARSLVVGATVDIDRADYYEPTTYMLYLRRVFGSSATRLAEAPRPVRLYSDY